MAEATFETATDAVALVSEYLDLNPMPKCCNEILQAVKSIMTDYNLGPEYVGLLTYELEYYTGLIC